MSNSIPLGMIGISHKTAPVEVRDSIALTLAEQQEFVRNINEKFDLDGGMIISTCNRTEVYVSGEKLIQELQRVKVWLNEFKNCTFFTNKAYVYELYAEKAVSHYFQVIAGIDSQIIGEIQIAGQVKDSYELAHEMNATDTLLNKLFNYAMQAKKHIYNHTYLSDGTVSVSFAGVELARKIFNHLSGKEVLVLGAGRTAELAAYHFMENQVKKIHVVNRTFERGQLLAEKFRGEAYPMDKLSLALKKSDIVISATSSSEYLITDALLYPVSKEKHYQPVFLIDLAIPRNIDPAIQQIDGVFLYNLDDLQEIVAMNLEKRKKEIPKSLKIVDEYVFQFKKWNEKYSMASVAGKLKKQLNQIKTNEINRLKGNLSEDMKNEMESLTENIINKIVRQHVKSLKRNAHDPERYQQNLELIARLFDNESD